MVGMFDGLRQEVRVINEELRKTKKELRETKQELHETKQELRAVHDELDKHMEDVDQQFSDIWKEADNNFGVQLEEEVTTAKAELQDFVKDSMSNTAADIVQRIRDAEVYLDIRFDSP